MTLKSRIPEASSAPQWLQKVQYTKNAIAYLEAGSERCRDIFNAPVFGDNPHVLFVSHPQALQQIFTNDSQQFSAPPNQHLHPLVGDYSIFTQEGARHRRERRLLMPPFHGERMRTYGELICDLVETSIKSLAVDTPFSAHQWAQGISMSVILKVTFGVDQNDRFNRFKSLITSFTDSLQLPWIGGLFFFPSLQKDWGVRSPWGYFQHLKRQVSNLIYTEISDRRHQNHATGSDILSLLMSAQDEMGQSMSDVELHDELLTLLIAGHETTAGAIAWALYWIHRHPQVKEKLIAELNSLGTSPDPAAIARLPYLTAVCHETLRLSPVALITVPREVKEPTELLGYSLNPGMRIYGCIYLTHQRPDLYPEPKIFRPERFLEQQFSAYEFFPFGGGVRRCIGEALALFEMKLVLATMLAQHRFALTEQAPESLKRRGVIFVPSRGVKMVLCK